MQFPSASACHGLPFIVASRTKQSWQEVLEIYQKCGSCLEGIYTPSPVELKHGLRQMPTAASTSSFYYSVVKEAYRDRRPDYSVSSLALKQFKQGGYMTAMKKVFEEDMDSHTIQGAQASLVLASYMGMWERALDLVRVYPKLRSTLGNKRLLIGTLCGAGRTAQALSLLEGDAESRSAAQLMRPIIRQLSITGEHSASLRLLARSLAAGSELSVSLFSAVIHTLRERGMSREALETAADLNLFSMSRSEAQRCVTLFNRLVDCLYDEHPYKDCHVDEIIREIAGRMSPRNEIFRTPTATQRFRLRTQVEMAQHLAQYVTPLMHIYTKVLSIPKWYSKKIFGIVEIAVTDNSMILVMDTNFLLQCVSKNLTMEHFRSNMRKQYPQLDAHPNYITVIPFTAIKEAYSVIWDNNNRLRHSVRVLLWSRVLAFLRQPSIFVLSLGCEYATSSISVVSAMSYQGLEFSGTPSPDSFRDPDIRVLNVCLFLQLAFRVKTVGGAEAFRKPIPEGAHLFAFLKYHVRRYQNSVKGSGCDKLILCTLDKRLSGAARRAGVNCFPAYRGVN